MHKISAKPNKKRANCTSKEEIAEFFCKNYDGKCDMENVERSEIPKMQRFGNGKIKPCFTINILRF